MRVKSGTLVASTVTTVTLTDDFDFIEVTNVDGAAAIFVRLGGTAPTVGGGNDIYALPAVVCEKRIPSPEASPTIVKLISSGTPMYAVNGVNP